MIGINVEADWGRDVTLKGENVAKSKESGKILIQQDQSDQNETERNNDTDR